MLFLWLVFRKEDMHYILDEILNANYWWIGLSIICALISHIFRAIRWNLLIKSLGYKTKTSTTFYAVMIGYLANAAIPRLGEVTRCGVLSKKDKIPFNSLFGTVIAERLFDMIILLLIIVLAILLQLKLVGNFVNEKIFIPLFSNVENNILSIILISILIVAVIIISIILIKNNQEKIRKLPIYKKAKTFLKGLFEGIKTINKTEKKGLFLLYTMIIWGMYILIVYFPFFALKETSGLSLEDAATAMSIGSLGIVAPVPGGIGTYHFFMKATLIELYGVNPAAATSFATITHAAQALMIILVGTLSFIMILIQKRRITNGTIKYNQIQDPQ